MGKNLKMLLEDYRKVPIFLDLETAKTEAVAFYLQKVAREVRNLTRGLDAGEFFEKIRKLKFEYSFRYQNDVGLFESCTLNIDLYSDLFSIGSTFKLLRPLWCEIDKKLKNDLRIFEEEYKRSGVTIPEGYKIDPYSGNFYPSFHLVSVLSGIHGDERTTFTGVENLLDAFQKKDVIGIAKKPDIYFNLRTNEGAISLGQRGNPLDLNQPSSDPSTQTLRDMIIKEIVASIDKTESSLALSVDFHNIHSPRDRITKPDEVGEYDFSAKPFICVALDSDVEINNRTLTDPEIRQIIDLAKWMGIDEVKFYHENLAKNTIIGATKYTSKQKITSIIFEFPQTHYSDGMLKDEYELTCKKEVYLSTGTLSKAMLYFNGLTRDDDKQDLSLAIQLQFIAGNSIPTEILEEPSITYIAPYHGDVMTEDSPNVKHYISNSVPIAERRF